MPLRYLLILFVFSFLACRHKEKELEQMKFDQQKWMVQENHFSYKYRGQMVMDLIGNKRLTGTHQKKILTMLGQPTRTDSNYFFYRLSQKMIGNLPMHTRTLVLKFENDTVAWAKIHQ